MSHQLTKKVKQRLAEYGAKITTPGYAPGVPTAISAAELKASGYTTDRAGKPVKATESYYLAPPPAVNHTRRLQSTYAAGGWPAVEVYLQPFMTPEYAAKQLAARAAGADEALHPLAAELQPFGALPPIDEQQPDAERVCEPAAGPSLMAEFFSAGVEGPISPEAELLIAQSVAAVDKQLAALLPEVQVPAPAEPREFTKLCQRWEAEADAATGAPGAAVVGAWLDESGPVLAGQLGQLYEAGHAGPLPDLVAEHLQLPADVHE
jgi:hypothetical protein